MQKLNVENFAVIVECGSLTKAAEKLYVSQSSLSQYLKRLEKNLGVALFDRNTAPMRLTYAGERYYAYVSRLRQMDQDIRKELIDLRDENCGLIRLGIPFWRSACMLPDFFPAFHRDYPGIRLELTEGPASSLTGALLENVIDLAVINLSQSLEDDCLEAEVIFNEPILYAAPNSHPAVQQILSYCQYNGQFPVAPISLVNEIPLIFSKPGQHSTQVTQHFIKKNGLHPEIVIETGNLTTGINLAAKGVGAVFVPAEGASTCRRPELLTFFLLDTSDLFWNLSVVYRRGYYLGRFSRLLIDTIKEKLSSSVFYEKETLSYPLDGQEQRTLLDD